jgi:hypothetical protein
MMGFRTGPCRGIRPPTYKIFQLAHSEDPIRIVLLTAAKKKS